MKKLFPLLSGILLMLIVAGCTSVKRFKSATFVGQDNNLVDMQLFGSRLTTNILEYPSRNLWDLSAGAQTQLIQILNERYPDNGQFFSALSNEYLANDDAGNMNRTVKNLRMVFTVSKQRNYPAINDASGRFSPADRIEHLKFSLEIPEEYNLSFKEWNRYTTEYGEIEIADVSFNRSLTLDAEVPFGQQSDAGGRGIISRNEEVEVRSRYLKINGSISDRKIEVEEEGTREIDLTGNVIADVSLEFEGFPERITIPVFSEAANTGEEVAAVRFMDVLVPRMEDAPDTLFAHLQLDYIYRHVVAGWKTYQEWDDQVEYYSGSVNRAIPLFARKDYLPKIYSIGSESDGLAYLKIRAAHGVVYPLQFKDYLDATRVLEWLLDVEDDWDIPVVIGTNTIVFEGIPLTKQYLSGIDLKVLPVY